MKTQRYAAKSFMEISVLICCLLSACGNNPPSEMQIKEDIAQQLIYEYGDGFALDHYEITQSITEDHIYTAEIEANATGKYADLLISIDLQYTSYDQGWQNDYISCCLNSFDVVRYPTNDEIISLQNACNTNSDWPVKYDTIEYGADYITCSGSVCVPYDIFYLRKGYVSSTWNYSIEDDAWNLGSQNKDYYSTLGIDVEGKWKQSDREDYIYIKNQTETGIDILIENMDYVGDRWIHVELEKSWDTDAVVYEAADELKVSFNYHSRSNDLTLYVEPLRGWFSSGRSSSYSHGFFPD